MYTNVSMYDFEQAFRNADRSEQFSYEGLKALFEWLEDFESDTGQPWELDVIALCCDWIEDDRESILEAYNSDDVTCLEDHTTVIEINGGDRLLIQQF